MDCATIIKNKIKNNKILGKVTAIRIEQVPPKKDIAVIIYGIKIAMTLGIIRKIIVKIT